MGRLRAAQSYFYRNFRTLLKIFNRVREDFILPIIEEWESENQGSHVFNLWVEEVRHPCPENEMVLVSCDAEHPSGELSFKDCSGQWHNFSSSVEIPVDFVRYWRPISVGDERP